MASSLGAALRWTFCFAMALSAVSDTLGAADLPSSAFCQEDSCSSGELSLRQLRATKSLVPEEEADVEDSWSLPSDLEGSPTKSLVEPVADEFDHLVMPVDNAGADKEAADVEDSWTLPSDLEQEEQDKMTWNNKEEADVEEEVDASPPESDGPLGEAMPGGWGEASEAAEHLDQGLVDKYRTLVDLEEKLGNGPSGQNLRTLYHQTGAAAAGMTAGPLILANGFKPGSTGGGGIYFATSPLQTESKAIGPDSHIGFMIKATVDVGRLKPMGRQCNKNLNGKKLASMGYDSVTFNPADGQEYIVYSSDRVLSAVQVPYHCSRRCRYNGRRTVCTKCR
ncbi:unnamed protein product, partial [Polarella glacialis]